MLHLTPMPPALACPNQPPLRWRTQALCPGELQLAQAAADMLPGADADACVGTPGPFLSPGSLLEGDAGATFGAFSGTPTLWTHQREQETGMAGAPLKTLRAGPV